MAVELRPMTDDDVPAVCALQDRANAADGVPRVLDDDELREDIGDHDWNEITRVALLDGELAGYAWTQHIPSEELWVRCYVNGAVEPAQQGRGVGRALLAWSVEQARAQLAADPSPLPKHLRASAYEGVPTERLLRRAGFAAVRWFEELVRPLDDLPAMPSLPGITIDAWPEDADEATRTVKNASFADHWGSTPAPADIWARIVHGFGARVDLSFVARDESSGEIVGICHNERYEADDAVLGRTEAWIGTLGTLRAWRGRGIASALIAASLHAFANAGLSHAAIGVDAASPTGANELYRRLGFTVARRSVTYELPDP